MHNFVTLLQTNGLTESVEVGVPVDVRHLGRLIGARAVDSFNTMDGFYVIVTDDDGIEKKLPRNALATTLYQETCGARADRSIWGDALMVPIAFFLALDL